MRLQVITVTAVLLLVALVIYALLPMPVNVSEDVDGASIDFFVEQSHFLAAVGCSAVRWQVEGIKAVELNGTGVVGAGESRLCDGAAALRVTLPDDRLLDYRVEAQVVINQPVFWLLVAVALVALGVMWRGVPLLISVGLMITAGVVLRDLHLFQTMRYDESATFLRFASRPLGYILSNYSEPNNHLFNSLLIHFLYHLFGNQPWVLRLPAFIAGILILPMIYVVARQHYGQLAGVIGVALAVPLAPLILFSTNARGYTLVTLMFLVMLALAYRLRRQDRWLEWGLFGAAAVVGAYTIPIMLYPAAIACAWLLLSILTETQGTQRRHLLIRFAITLVLSVLATFLLYLPVLLTTGLGSLVGNEWVSASDWATFLESVQRLQRDLPFSWFNGLPEWVIWLSAAGAVTALLLHWWIAPSRVPLPLLAVLVVLIMTVPLQRVAPVRGWLYLLPLYCIAAGGGIAAWLRWARLDRQGIVNGVGVLLVVLTVWQGSRVLEQEIVFESFETGIFRPAERVTQALLPLLTPNDRVITIGSPQEILRYYFVMYGIDSAAWDLSGTPPEKLFVVVNTRRYTLDETLADYTDYIEDYQPPQLVRQFHEAEIYLLSP